MGMDLHKIKELLEDIKNLINGNNPEDKVKKELLLITLDGRDALMYRALMVIFPQEVQGEITKEIFLEGLKSVTVGILKAQKENLLKSKEGNDDAKKN